MTQVQLGLKIGYVDACGKVILTPQFDSADKFDNGFAVVHLLKESQVEALARHFQSLGVKVKDGAALNNAPH